MEIVFFAVAMLACLIGKICGIGGGVIIKPVLDAYGLLSVEAINYLSGCTVFGMCLLSVCRGFLRGKSQIALKTSTPLAVGAAMGGVFGKSVFSLLQQEMKVPEQAGAVQASLLFVITLLTLFYTVRKDGIVTLHVKSGVVSIMIGAVLGALGSFLGIGGGPMNIAAWYFFYYMSKKEAAQNSLYIIFISQGAGLLRELFLGSIPDVSMYILAGMILFGIIGGALGSRINFYLSERAVQRLFEGLLILIMCINVYNISAIIF